MSQHFFGHVAGLSELIMVTIADYAVRNGLPQFRADDYLRQASIRLDEMVKEVFVLGMDYTPPYVVDNVHEFQASGPMELGRQSME